MARNTTTDWSPQLATAARYRNAADRHRDKAKAFDDKAADLEERAQRKRTEQNGDES